MLNGMKSVSIKSNDIEFLNDKNGKKLIGEILFDFNDVEKFLDIFKLKEIIEMSLNQIKADFVYDFTENKLILNNLKIDNKSNQKIEKFLEEYNKKIKNLFNKVTFRNFVKDFFKFMLGKSFFLDLQFYHNLFHLLILFLKPHVLKLFCF